MSDYKKITKVTKTSALFAFTLFFIPNFVYAADTVLDILNSFAKILNQLMPTLLSFAIIFFLWGLLKYMLKTDDVEGRVAAKNIMFWGVIIIFVIVSLWGLVNFLGTVIKLENTAPDFPTLTDTPSSNSSGPSPDFPTPTRPAR